MINDFMSIAEKDGFPIWAAIMASATLIIYLITTIAIRAFYLYFDKKRESKTPEQTGYESAYVPEYFFNSVMEIMVSNTCILGVLYLYFSITPKIQFLSEYFGLILLFLILLAIICNQVIDYFWLDKTWLRGDKYPKNYLRLTSSISILLIGIIFSIVFKTNQYISVIVLLFGLILGRFIYFDSTVESIWGEIINVLKCWKSFCIAVVLMIILLLTGVHYGIIDANNAISTLFFAHCFYLITTEVCIKVFNDINF